MKKLGFLILLLIGLDKILFPENTAIKFQQISIEQGLSQNIVQCILQDNKGFMWIGTDDGLNKYDGYNFKTYHNNPNNHNSLSHNRISSIYQDRKGILWIGTIGGGLNKFIPGEEKFLRYTANENDPDALSDNNVISIVEDRQGILWLGTYNGLNKFDREKETFTHYLPGNPTDDYSRQELDNWVTSIHQDTRGQLWIGTRGGLNRFDRRKGKFKRYPIAANDPNHFNDNNKINSICEDRSGLLWIGTYGGGVKIFDPGKEEFIRTENKPLNTQKLFRERIEWIFMDHSGFLWIGTDDGLFKLNPRTDKCELFQNDPENTGSLIQNFVNAIYEDRTHVMWIGTYGGLSKFDNKKKKFTHYLLSAGNSKETNAIFSIYRDSLGTLWLGTSKGGLVEFDREKGTANHYGAKSNDPDSLSGSIVLSILEGNPGELWLGTDNKGLYKFDYPTKKFYRFMHVPGDPDSLSNNYIWNLYKDRRGVLWIGTENGLNKFDSRGETFTAYKNEPHNPNSLSHNKISKIYEDPSGLFWLGTYDGGLNRYDRKTNQFTRYLHDADDPHSLSDNKIYSIHEDQKGHLWIGTNSGGLNQFNKKTGTFKHYTREDGLPNNVIFSILEDQQGNLWLSTNRGLSKFNPQTGTFRNYTIADGMQGYEFFQNSHFKSKDGEMFFGGIYGFNAFYPENVRDNPYIPHIIITSFSKFNQEVKLGQPISEIKRLKLSYKDYIFSFKFAALEYTATGRNQYTYKMEGLNDNWIHLGHKHDITFTGLPAREYVFRVKGSNNDGVWNQEGASIAISILPPFWSTWWFKLVMVILCFGVLALVYRIRTNNLKQKLEKDRLEKELKLKADFTAMLIHDLRSPLTAVIGYSELLMENPGDIDIAKTGKVIASSAERMLTLINDMLDMSKFEAGKMSLNRKNVRLFKIATNIIEVMKPLLERKGIHLQWQQEPGTRQETLFIDPVKIGQVINNLLSNAIKFTPENGNIIVKLSRLDTGQHSREISVTDDGPGVPAKTQKSLFDKYAQLNIDFKTRGTGLGLAVSKMIVESHGGTIGYRDGINGKGSTFYFRLPLTDKR